VSIVGILVCVAWQRGVDNDAACCIGGIGADVATGGLVIRSCGIWLCGHRFVSVLQVPAAIDFLRFWRAYVQCI
jgi:hypothetical protein